MRVRRDKLLLCVLAGIALNLSIAWIIAGASPVPIKDWGIGGRGPGGGGGNPRWPETAPPDWPSPAEDYFTSGGGMWTHQAWGQIVKLPDRANSRKTATLGMTAVSVGFPFPCMTWASHYDTRATPGAAWIPTWRSAWIGGITPPWATGNAQTSPRIPLRPVYAGFIANSLVFALAVWGGARCIALARRKRWTESGRCGGCGYSLSGLTEARCPECGAPRPPTAQPSS